MNRIIGVAAIVFSIVVVFVWIPLDVESGLIEKVRRSINLGDAFAPTVAGVLVGIGGVLCLVASFAANTNWQGANGEPLNSVSGIAGAVTGHIRHALILLAIFIVGLSLMRYSGPVITEWLHENKTEYRLLRDTVPWKYIGFILGGTVLISTLIAWTERRLRPVHILIGIVATLTLIAVYDLPFDDLLLPPNGDV